MHSLSRLLVLLLLVAIGCVSAQNCSVANDLQATDYTVTDAASDNCTLFPTPQPRAFWIPPISEALRINLLFPHVFSVLAYPNGTISSARLVARLIDNSTADIEFDLVLDFNSFLGRCGNNTNLELSPTCYESLQPECYQCFDSWNGTLTSVPGTAYDDAVIEVTSRSSHPQAQTGVGANNKNVNFGLSGWCNWSIRRNCRATRTRRSIICPSKAICDINVDLFAPPPPAVSGDPHFVGFRGQRFDFHGEVDKVFNLITDTSLQVNALFVNADLRPKKLHKTYIGELGIVIGQHKLRFACNRGYAEHIVEFDGQELLKSKPFSLSDENYAMVIRDVNDKITIDYHPFLLRAWFSSSRHSSCHITLRSSYSGGSAMTLPHGVLGQTVSPLVLANNALGPKSMQGEGIIAGHWKDYEIIDDDLYGTNFKFNRFDETLDSESNFLNQGQNEESEEAGDTMSASTY